MKRNPRNGSIAAEGYGNRGQRRHGRPWRALGDPARGLHLVVHQTVATMISKYDWVTIRSSSLGEFT